MTAKSIVQVEVQDEQFREFYSLFQEYQEKLAEGSDAWKATTESIDDAEGAMEKLLDLSGQHADAATIAAYQATVIAREIRAASVSNNALLEGLTKNTKAQKGFANETERSNKAFEKLKKNADGVAHSIFGIGKWILKLGALGGGLAGLGGLLSGLGLKELASSAVDTQRNARGLGITPGQYTAFNQDFGRYIDPSVLGTIANSQNSFAGRNWLAMASGLTQQQVSTQGPDELAAQLALKAHDWWVNTPESMRTAENLQTTGLPQSGFSLEMVRQEGNTPRGELERAYAQYQQDQKRFNVSDKDTDAWYGFLRQIKDAGNTIETSLKNKLVALAPDLQRFTDVIGKDAEKLITQIFTPKNLQSLEDGIGKLTDYLGSKQFGQDIKDFSSAVSRIAADAKELAGVIDRILHPFGTNIAQETARQQQDIGGGLIDAGKDIAHGKLSDAWRKLTAPLPGDQPDASTAQKFAELRHGITLPQDPKAKLAALDKQYQLPAGTLEGMWWKESREGKQIIGPKLKNGDQAIGDFQFTSAAWKDWGNGGDRFNFNDEADAAGRYMASLTKRYGGDVKKALAAYNWGPGNVDKAGANWQSRAPAETKDYVSQISARIAQLSTAIDRLRQSPQGIQITNNTAARVAVQANAAAIQ